MKKLDDYSQRFADVLFKAFPSWREFASIETTQETSQEGFLLVKVPTPIKGLSPSGLIPTGEDCLRIDSDGEITIGFDYYHTHFDKFSGSALEEEEFKQAVEFLNSLINEEIYVAIIMEGEKWRGSTSAKVGEELDLSWLTKRDGLSAQVYVRSWKGTYNRKYNLQKERD